MKRIIDKIKNKKIIYFMLGLIMAYTITKVTVYAATSISSASVPFANSTTGINPTNMQAALNEAYNNVKTSKGILYAVGDPTSSSTATYNYMTLVNSGYNLFMSLNGTRKSVCIYYNESLACFYNDNYTEESSHIKNVFGSTKCTSYSSYITCDTTTYYCVIYNDGEIDFRDMYSGHRCNISSSGTINCY